jgi:hypothetical protein
LLQLGRPHLHGAPSSGSSALSVLLTPFRQAPLEETLLAMTTLRPASVRVPLLKVRAAQERIGDEVRILGIANVR